MVIFIFEQRRENKMTKGSGASGYNHTQQQRNDYANQNNPNNSAYKANLGNDSKQNNPNHSTQPHNARSETKLSSLRSK